MSQETVGVDLRIDETGRIRPLRIHWHDYTLAVDRLIDIRPGASLKIGCAGTRYTCRVQGRLIYLYNDNELWYMEAGD
jgi:hypothetical protein